MTTVVNPFLAGNFAPVDDEITTFDLEFDGRIPAELEGRLLRIGPNPAQIYDPDKYHWFTGTGMAHGVRIRDGRAEWYRNRFVRSDAEAAQMGWDPVPGPKNGFIDISPNTNIIGHADKTFAVVEAGAVPVELSYELETICRTDFGATLPGGFTAHPKRDPESGELHAVTYYFEWDYLQYIVVGVDGTVRKVVDVPVPGRPMVHDCAITESHVLLFDLPVLFDLEGAMSGTLSLPYRWMPEYGARVGVLPRDGDADDVRWCELDEPCYVYHPLNAFDHDDDTITLDVVRHSSTFVDGALEGDDVPTLERWTLDPAAGKVRREVLSDRPQEFPRLDERLVGRRHRYGYTAETPPADTGLAFGSLVKHDLAARTEEIHDVGTSRATMEPVFVPRRADSGEDDGWVLAYVHDYERNACDVMILEAQDFTAEPVATIHLPRRVPFGFHGNWVPDN